MEYEDIIVTKQDGMAIITLNRPDKMNSLSQAMMRDLPLAIEEVGRDDEVRVLVITGAGRGFCSGADVRNLRERVEGNSEAVSGNRRLGVPGITRALHDLDKPTIAMVNGAAVGAGCDIALTCDMRIASDRARFGEVYIKLGIVPAEGGVYLLPRAIGVARACELLFTGDIIDAREADRIGLVNKVVPADELEAETMDLARKIAVGPPIALRLTKRGIYDCLGRDFPSAMEYTSRILPIAQGTEDHKEGLRAFAEKRQPIFKGR